MTAMTAIPKPGDTVDAWMHTTDGRLVYAEVIAGQVVKLNCGCHRISAARPGPVFDRACTGVDLLTGCGMHPGHLGMSAMTPDERARVLAVVESDAIVRMVRPDGKTVDVEGRRVPERLAAGYQMTPES